MHMPILMAAAAATGPVAPVRGPATGLLGEPPGGIIVKGGVPQGPLFNIDKGYMNYTTATRILYFWRQNPYGFLLFDKHPANVPDGFVYFYKASRKKLRSSNNSLYPDSRKITFGGAQKKSGGKGGIDYFEVPGDDSWPVPGPIRGKVTFGPRQLHIRRWGLIGFGPDMPDLIQVRNKIDFFGADAKSMMRDGMRGDQDAQSSDEEMGATPASRGSNAEKRHVGERMSFFAKGEAAAAGDDAQRAYDPAAAYRGVPAYPGWAPGPMHAYPMAVPVAVPYGHPTAQPRPLVVAAPHHAACECPHCRAWAATYYGARPPPQPQQAYVAYPAPPPYGAYYPAAITPSPHRPMGMVAPNAMHPHMQAAVTPRPAMDGTATATPRQPSRQSSRSPVHNAAETQGTSASGQSRSPTAVAAREVTAMMASIEKSEAAERGQQQQQQVPSGETLEKCAIEWLSGQKPMAVA